jgi:fatty-acyl-CoA synthase
MTEATNLVELLKTRAMEYERGITFIKGEKEEDSISYADLYQDALQLLHDLQAKNLQPGDEVIFQVEDNRKFITAFWACILGGLIPVPLTIGNNDEHRLKFFSVWKILYRPYLITDKNNLDYLTKFQNFELLRTTYDQIMQKTVQISETLSLSSQGIIHHPGPGDMAFIQFSSGSTGEPKGVILSHQNLLANIEAIIFGAQIKLQDKALSWMPLTHDMGLIGFHLSSIAVNIQQYLMPTALFIRRPLLWPQKAHEHQVTVLMSPNFGYKYLLTALKTNVKRDWDLSKIRLIFNGAEPISISLCKQFLNRMADYNLNNQVMFPVYGLAEACLGVTFPIPGENLLVYHLARESLAVGQKIIMLPDPTDANRVSFVDEGYPVLYCQVRICNHDHQELAENMVGHILICGTNVTCGYYNHPQATAKVMTDDGWLDTGDLGFMQNGRLIVTGRAKDIIFINGQNYYPHDIERIAEEVDGLELGKVAACGIFNEKHQKEELFIFIVFKKELEQFIPLAQKVKQRISIQIGIETKIVIPVKKFPKTTSGKIQRYKLAERYQAGEFVELVGQIQKMIPIKNKGDGEAEKPLTSTEKMLVDICTEVLGEIPLGIHDSFIEFGTNSMVLSNIYQRLDNLCPGQFTIATLFDYPSIAKLAAFIDRDRAQEIEPLILPEDYFRKGTFSEEIAAFQFELDEDLSRKIREFAINWKMSCSELLLSVYFVLCQEEFGAQKVTIHGALQEKHCLIPITVNFDYTSNREALYYFVNQVVKENIGSYSFAQLVPRCFPKKKNAIFPLFYKNDFVFVDEALLECFEITIGIDEVGTTISITCDFNHHRFIKEKILELLRSYFRVIKKMLGLSI